MIEVNDETKTDVITTMDQALPLLDWCKQWLIDQGLRGLADAWIDLDIGFDSDSTLSLSVSTGCPSAIMRCPEKYIIFMRRGAGRTYCMSCLIHELGHAWLFSHGVPYAPDWASEGFCQMLSHRFLSQVDTQESRDILSRMGKKENMYGKGLRWILPHVHAIGFESLLERIMSTKSVVGEVAA